MLHVFQLPAYCYLTMITNTKEGIIDLGRFGRGWFDKPMGVTFFHVLLVFEDEVKNVFLYIFSQVKKLIWTNLIDNGIHNIFD